MNAVPPLLDHLVLATWDLASAVADFTRRTGLPVTPLPAVSATAPDPDAIHPLLTVLGTGLALAEGPVALSFTVDTPRGPVAFD
ncbi:hypothetical protein ACFC09_02135 [Streptomyces sp. NPDC056161]|uniref:hypothetical protein n=1 Tax=Streptomyces sp. NPDC056161 TaxID=3345732 RepID=UPI0035DC192A